MPVAYSMDLRKRVMEAVEKGLVIGEISKLFNISRKVIYNWINLKKKTGDIISKKNYQKGHSHKIKDWIQFKEFINNNENCTLNELAERWNEKNPDNTLSDTTIQRGLKKINYSVKKKLFSIKKQVKKKEINS